MISIGDADFTSGCVRDVEMGRGSLLGIAWECTHHVQVGGEMVHVAAAPDCIVSVRLQDGTIMEFTKDHGRTLTWGDVLPLIERAIKPVSEEEVEQARDALQRMLREIES